MLVVEPIAEPAATELAAAPRLRDLPGKRVGSVDDGKSNARQFLEARAAI